MLSLRLVDPAPSLCVECLPCLEMLLCANFQVQASPTHSRVHDLYHVVFCYNLFAPRCLPHVDKADVVCYTAVSGFVFLRFFAPAILNPKLFNLRHENPVSGYYTSHCACVYTLPGEVSLPTIDIALILCVFRIQ